MMTKKPDRTTPHAKRCQSAYMNSALHLATANRLSETGEKEKAERFYELSSKWLDKYNKLIGNA